MRIGKLTIEGFKSIRKLDEFTLSPLTVLIGPNGAGKSNFVGFFRLLRELIEQRLELAVRTEGGADACLYMGPKVTKSLIGKVYFGSNGYEFELVPTVDNKFVFSDERTVFFGDYGLDRKSLGSGQAEGKLKVRKDEPGKLAAHGVAYHVFRAVSSWVVYHFHDTSPSAQVRRQGAVNDNEFLRPSAENLAAFLFRLSKTNPLNYQRIRDTIRLAAPFFDDFKLRPVPGNQELIQLEWLQRDSDYFFRPSQLSDGTLRFICLTTALLQPSPPSTMLFDEPELGLHPFALTLLGNLFKQASHQFANQVIISTQSASLLNEFDADDVVVVERKDGQSTFRRLESTHLSTWLEEYALGELWQKNILGGRPRSDQAQDESNGAYQPHRNPARDDRS